MSSINCGLSSVRDYTPAKNDMPEGHFSQEISCSLSVSEWDILVFPLTLRFLAEYQVSEMVPNQISLDSYMSNFLTLNFIMGLVFELPLLCWLLSNMGLITRRFFKTYRRHAIVILLILAAFITPSSDPFTLSVVFVPLYALYELSAWVVKPASQKDDGNSEEDSNEILDEH